MDADNKQLPSGGKRRPPAAGMGRKLGSKNKATKNAREAISRLVDDNSERLQEWLEEIANTEGPLAAWKCFMDVVEYHIPKLARTEIKADVNVRTVSDELSELNTKTHVR